jgi:hypothetical protein
VSMSRILVRLPLFSEAKRSLSPRIGRSSKRRKAFVAVTTGGVVCVILHIGLVAASEFSKLLRDPIYGDKELRLKRLERGLPQGSPSILFVGSSRTAHGFQAGLAQEQLTASLDRPASAFNWGIPATGPVSHLLHLRRLIKDGHRPSLLFLEVHPLSFASIPGGVLDTRQIEGTSLDWSELKWIGDYNFPVEHLREQRRMVAIAPWYALRFKIMGRLDQSIHPIELHYDWSRSTDKNGWAAESEVNDEERAAGMSVYKKAFGVIFDHLTFDDGSVRAFRDLLNLAHQERIPVALVRMPEAAGLLKLVSPDVNAKFDRFLDQFAAEQRVQIHDARNWITDDGFTDGCHLQQKGAGEFTRRLSREMIEPFLQSSNR